jgi:hypothetical protein
VPHAPRYVLTFALQRCRRMTAGCVVAGGQARESKRKLRMWLVSQSGTQCRSRAVAAVTEQVDRGARTSRARSAST